MFSASACRLMAATAAALLASCQSGPRPSAPGSSPSLVGTAWELVQVQSMDDAQGTTRIADPSLYTVSFGSDGRATLRLDCNRAMGSWQAVPTSDGMSGSLHFGALAGTRAFCPPPSMDQRLLRDLASVRSYRLRDGLLHLSLMADAGIYSWRPAPVR